MSAHLTQYLCDIHTLELCVKDTFNNTLGMKTILKKTKKLAKFTHKSTVAAKELKREAEKQNIPFRKIANPPNTRWSGRLKNLSSVQHLQKPLINLTSTKENWQRHNITPLEWKLISGAVTLLEPVKDTVEALEGEKEPTMNRVLERLYSMHCLLDEFVADPSNSGIGFARELRRQIEKRFPEKGSTKPLPCMANYLAPNLKGIHLEEQEKMESTKDLIEQEWNKMQLRDESILSGVGEQPEEEEDEIELSPTSKLRKKMSAERASRSSSRHQQLRPDHLCPIRKEMAQYEALTLARKETKVLDWWKTHETVLPILAKVAKKVLTVPASSAKSERVFSTGRNVTVIIIIIIVVVVIIVIVIIIVVAVIIVIIILRRKFCDKKAVVSCPKES